MGILDSLNAFKHKERDEQLLERRKKLDIFLTVVFIVCMVIYAAFEGINVFNSDNFQSACYSTATSLPESNTLKIKHLCYTPEKKQYEHFALQTFRCRGDFGAYKWGTIDENRQQQQPQQQQQQQQQLLATDPHLQPKFCQAVIHNAEGELRAFVPKSTQDSCQGGGCHQNLDTSQNYRFFNAAGDNTLYYVVRGQPKGYTCCGMRPSLQSEKLLVWLGAVGGFAGVVKAVLQLVPPHTALADTSSASSGPKGILPEPA